MKQLITRVALWLLSFAAMFSPCFLGVLVATFSLVATAIFTRIDPVLTNEEMLQKCMEHYAGHFLIKHLTLAVFVGAFGATKKMVDMRD